MPLDTEDRTDISGSPPPIQAHTPAQGRADMLQKANQNKRGPQVQQQGGGGLGGFFSGLGSKAKEVAGDVQQGAEAVSNWPFEQGFAHPTANPIDWPSQIEQDASAAWAFGNHAKGVLSGRFHDGVHSLFQGDDIRSRLGQYASFGVANAIGSIYDSAESVPEAALSMDPSKLMTPQMAAERNVARGQPEQVVGEAPGKLSQEAAFFMPGGIAGKAAAALLPSMPELLSQNPDDVNAGLAWVAVGSLLSFGHVPAPLRKVLQRRFGAFGEVEKSLQDGLDAKQKAAEAAVDPEKENGLISSDIKQKLDAAANDPLHAGLHTLVDKLEGEPDLRDPSGPMRELPQEAVDVAKEHLGDLSDIVTELHTGLWATHENPVEQVGRAIAGHARSLDSTFDNYFGSLSKLLGKVSASQEVAMMKAAEGDMEVYEGLSATEKIAVDSWRIVAGAMRETSEDTIYARNFVANWVPRLDEDVAEVRGRGRPSGAAVLAREARRHRAVTEQVDAAGNPKLVQKYPTVQVANKALRTAREELTNHLLNPAQALRRSLAGNPEAAEIRRLFHEGDLEGARTRAIRMASDTFPLKNEHFLQAITRVAPYQARAIMSQRGINELSKTTINAAHPSGGVVRRAAAVNINGKRQRDIEQFLNQGYQHIDDPKFRGFVFDSQVAGMLRRLTQQSADLPGALEAAAEFNKQLLRITMYSPHIHGANLARRMGALSLNHPLEFSRFLAERKQPFAPLALIPAHKDDEARALRRFAHQSGVQPPRGAKGWLANFSDTVGTALGDTGDHVHSMGQDTRAGKMLQALSAPVQAYRNYEDGFWRWVSDFGVMAFHVEYRSAIHGGMEEAKARALAARKANSWMGMVLPEDSSPLFHKLSKLALFAPNWWRSMGELMVPIYRNSGIFEGPQDVRRAVGQGLKTVGSMYAVMKVSGELMNHMLSGHSQSENQPGHQDDVEIRNPAILHALQATGQIPAYDAQKGSGVDPNTGVDPRTGAHVYLRVGGQFEDVLQAAGFESGHSGHHIIGPLSAPGAPEDVQDGMTRFAAARLSPLMSFVPGLANFDTYRTLTQGLSPRAVVPGTQGPQVIPPNPLAVMLAVMQSLPGGQGLSQLVQQNQQQNGADSMSLFGTKVPTSLGEYTKALKVTGARAALTGLLGVNPPYAAAERSRGTPVPDADYQKVKELTDTYNRQNQTLGAEMLSGQVTPSAWLRQHRSASAQHSAQMKALFHNAPEYINGSSGLAADWESLYDKATNPDGTLDQAKLSELQAQFRSQHTADEMRQMNSVLRQGDSKNPALALYHHTLDAADKWEAQWAAQQGLDITTLRKENSEYNRLGTADKRKYLQQHRELGRLRTAIQRQFYRTPQGMLYALYRGDNQTVMRYLKAHHLTAANLESEVEQQEQTAA